MTNPASKKTIGWNVSKDFPHSGKFVKEQIRHVLKLIWDNLETEVQANILYEYNSNLKMIKEVLK